MAVTNPGQPGRRSSEGLRISRVATDQRAYMRLRESIRERLIGEVDARILSKSDRESMRNRVVSAMDAVLSAEGTVLPARLREQVINDVIDDMIGYGPIQPLLDDPTISDIMVNGPDEVYAERKGKVFRTDRMFRDERHIMQIIEKIVVPLGRKIDESSPMVDARLPDGSRVNAIIPPLSINGPTLTIRKFAPIPYTMKDLIEFGTLTEEMAEFLRACVLARLNIIVSGGGSSGKTTTLNVLSSYIPNDERIVTIEDSAELQLQQSHVIGLESRPPNIEGKGEITIRSLLRNALRMRPDRIIVGEVRGGEALDMLQGMTTGEGSMSTLHSNSPRDTLSRLETMVLMAGMDLPSRAIREQIVAGVHLIVHESRLRDGSRKITHITEVQSLRGDTIRTRDIFVFDQQGVSASGEVIGQHRATGLRPLLLHRLSQQGLKLSSELMNAFHGTNITAVAARRKRSRIKGWRASYLRARAIGER